MRIKEQPDFLEVLNTFINEYMRFSAGLSENTVRLYKATFRLLLNYLYEVKQIEAEKVTFQVLNFDLLSAFLDWLETSRGCSAATRNVRLAALSSFARYAQNRNFDAALVFLNAVKKIPTKKTAVAPRLFFSREEVTILLRMPNSKTAIGQRDSVLLSLMYASGARAQEICDLRVRDVAFESEATRITLTGKGGKSRRIIIAHPCAAMLKRHIAQRGIACQPDRHIFSSQSHEHMTISCVEAIFKKYVGAAKKKYPALFQEKGYSPHTMRHTCAMHMLEAGIPLLSIKNFLGHASVLTTERYAELTQSTVDKHIKEWNQRWFEGLDASQETKNQANLDGSKGNIPDFLK